MKRILFLSFYFEPDLCAGSFRNSPLADELARQAGDEVGVDVLTTLPNRYASFRPDASREEVRGNLLIRRFEIPSHEGGFLDQARAFRAYSRAVKDFVAERRYDVVYASTSRFFTGHLGYRIASRRGLPLYLDLRDIFVEKVQDMLPGKTFLRSTVFPVLRHVERRVLEYASHVNLISEGFETYLEQYPGTPISVFTHGIDALFLEAGPSTQTHAEVPVVAYAGNIGRGQSLELILPPAAKALEGRVRFVVVGDGSTKPQLEDALKKASVTNVELRNPVARRALVDFYGASDYLFIHQNDSPSRERDTPSKVFELAAFDKPILAGVGGFSAEFIRRNVPNAFVFPPGDVGRLVEYLATTPYRLERREEFVQRFRRGEINRRMAASILDLMPDRG